MISMNTIVERACCKNKRKNISKRNEGGITMIYKNESNDIFFLITGRP